MLARREHSRAEILRRLTPLAESAEQVGAVLDKLEALGFLSEARFAASLSRRRSERYGAVRVAHELQQHRIDPSIAEPLLGGLRASERERALEVWSRRFGAKADTLAEKGRQYRFLTRRGFSGDMVHWVLRYGAAATGAGQDSEHESVRAQEHDQQADPID